MKFIKTRIKGVYLIKIEKMADNRGFFSRIFCKEELSKLGIIFDVAQVNLTYNKKKSTLRGLHFQKPPHEEQKIIRCIKGEIFDVVVDLRPESKTYLKWIGMNLSAKNRLGLFIPRGMAHGFITLEDETELIYLMSESYNPASSATLNWNDPRVSVDWPIKATIVSEKDNAAPYLEDLFEKGEK